MLKDFFNLIFPKLCAACNHTLLHHENTICTQCQINLPKTNYHHLKDNSVCKIFWGRIEVEMATAFYQFSKKSKVQHLLHQLKYKGNKEVGRVAGEWFGYELVKSDFFQNIDVIIPIPLHPKKKKIRGYNQSEWIAKGLADAMDVALDTHSVYRKVHTQTQTKKARYDRWENVNSIFGIHHPEKLKNKSVLIVDDVITTGATIEACATDLKALGCKIYVAVLAAA
jgi:ComF family protein